MRNISTFLNNTIYVCVVALFAISFVCLSTLTDSHWRIIHFFVRASRWIHVLLFLILLYELIKNKIDIKIFCLILLFFVVSFLSYRTARNPMLFDLILIPLFFSKILEEKKIYLAFLLTSIVLFLLIVLLNSLEIIPHYVYARNGHNRYSLGFGHPNALAVSVYLISMLYVLVRNRIHFLDYLILFLGVGFCYYIPKSYSSSFAILLLITVLLFSNFINRFSISLKVKRYCLLLITVILVFIVAFSYFVSITSFGTELLNKLPGAFVDRFEWGRRVLNDYNLTMFGQHINLVDSSSVTSGSCSNFYAVDSLYFFLPIEFGIVPSLIYIASFFICLRRCLYSNKYTLFFMLLIAFLYGMTEHYQTQILFMFLFLYGLSEFKKESYLGK